MHVFGQRVFVGFFSSLLISSRTTKTRFAWRPLTEAYVALFPLHLFQLARPCACACVRIIRLLLLFCDNAVWLARYEIHTKETIVELTLNS